MTTQTRKFIELADILGMRFDCRKCHASRSYGNDWAWRRAFIKRYRF
ncbi:MAG: hypothetical protein WCF73_06340 [Candidatus Sulfotelmatobacter sp.]